MGSYFHAWTDQVNDVKTEERNMDTDMNIPRNIGSSE